MKERDFPFGPYPAAMECFLMPRVAAETIASLHLRISRLEYELFTLKTAREAKASRLSRFQKEAFRKAAKHPAHVVFGLDPGHPEPPESHPGPPESDQITALRYGLLASRSSLPASEGKAWPDDQGPDSWHDQTTPLALSKGEGAGGEGESDPPTLSQVLFDPYGPATQEPHV